MQLKKWHRWGLVAVFLAQLGVLAGMIAIHERALRKGSVYRVRCAPRDPVDLFRGRYLAITLAPLHGSRENYKPALDKGYAHITKDADGFMQVGRIDAVPPSTGDYIEGRVQWWARGEKVVQFHLPFDRFYVPEDKALAIEEAFRVSPENSYLVLRVYRGFAAVEKLVLSGQAYF